MLVLGKIQRERSSGKEDYSFTGRAFINVCVRVRVRVRVCVGIIGCLSLKSCKLKIMNTYMRSPQICRKVLSNSDQQ